MRADRRASATVCAATFLAVRQYRKWCVSISCLCGRFRVYISAVRQYRKRCVSISPLCGRLLVSWIPRESPCSRAGFPDFDNPLKPTIFLYILCCTAFDSSLGVSRGTFSFSEASELNNSIRDPASAQFSRATVSRTEAPDFPPLRPFASFFSVRQYRKRCVSTFAPLRPFAS